RTAAESQQDKARADGVLLVLRRCWFGPGSSVQPSIHPELVSMVMGFSAASAAPSFRNGCVCVCRVGVSVRTDRAVNPHYRGLLGQSAQFHRLREG
ncbi:hypothetical protein GOODEAATRI_026183, partial [Goodea atripinnis]